MGGDIIVGGDPVVAPVERITQSTWARLGDSDIILGGVDVHGVRWSWQRGDAIPFGSKPAPREVSGENVNTDGDWDDTRDYGPRRKNLEVLAYAPDHQGSHDAQRRFEEAVNLGFRFRVVEHDLDRWAWARQDGELLWTDQSHTIARASVPIKMSDPRIYATVPTIFKAPLPPRGQHQMPHAVPHALSSSQVARTVTNGGNTTAWPRYRLVGPMVNPVIRNAKTGQFMRLELTLAAGEWLTINTHPDVEQVLLFGDPTLTRRGALWGHMWGFAPSATTEVVFTADNVSALNPPDQFIGEVESTWL